MAHIRAMVRSHTTVNKDVYQQWLVGKSLTEIVEQQVATHTSSAWPPPYLLYDLLLTEVKDEVRNYNILLHYLKHPLYLPTQRLMQLAPSTINILLEGYYGFDEAFMRQLLGKKLTMRRSRRKLESISRKVKISMHSCRRQFDNLKRIYRTIDDGDGTLIERIQKFFLLSPRLAQQYARILFLATKRFHLSKRRLQHIPYGRLHVCAGAMMEHWCTPPPTESDHEDEKRDIDFEVEFLFTLRDIRGRVNSDRGILDKWRAQVILKIEMRHQGESEKRLLGCVFKFFKPLIRQTLQLGGTLTRGTECRKFFVEIMDRLVDPTQRQTKLTRADIDLLYTLAAEGCGEIIAETENSSTTQITYIVHRLFTVVSVCVQQLMAADTQPKVGHGSEGGASGLAVFNRAAPESEKGPGRSVVGT